MTPYKEPEILTKQPDEMKGVLRLFRCFIAGKLDDRLHGCARSRAEEDLPARVLCALG